MVDNIYDIKNISNFRVEAYGRSPLADAERLLHSSFYVHIFLQKTDFNTTYKNYNTK